MCACTECVWVPEVIKGCRIDLLSEHISYSCICEDVRVKQSQTQSQQPEGQKNTTTINTCASQNFALSSTYINQFTSNTSSL